MGTKETNIMSECMIALSADGHLIFRNNVGAYTDPKSGRLVRYGLAVGSSDLVGVCSDGTALFVEIKTPTGRVSPAQEAFIAAVRRRGGRAGVARSPEEAVRIARPETG
jgi:hypothetical protein